MDCLTEIDSLTTEMIALARLAIAGGVVAIGIGTVYGILRIVDRWRRWGS